jgi:ankyrin repeat protein
MLTPKFGCTPLILAAKAGRVSTVKCLLEYGADPNIVDKVKYPWGLYY